MSDEQNTNTDITNGKHVIFTHEGRTYGGVIDDISPGGYGTVVGFGFIAEGVHTSICELNTLFHPSD